jgi:uncharacterized protein YqhQ
MSRRSATTEPRYMGGQAVLEGVMMRGESTYAIAVRKPEGEIVVDVRDVPGWSDRYRKIPIVRGVMGLAESLGLGYRALTWSANQQVPEEEQVSERTMGFAVVFSVVVFASLFIVLPLFVGGRLDDMSFLPFHLAEGLVRLGLFVGYLFAISFIPDIKRVFQYHGAEHKSIAAYENDVELSPESAQRFTTEHVRCGTNFLLTVMVLTIIVYSFVGRPGWFLLVASRVVLIPLIAGLSYEVIRFAAKHMQWRWVRVLMRPGLALQRLTTREPTVDQLEVAVVSLRAVLTAEQLAEVESRPRLVAGAVPRPAFGST